MVGKKGEGKQEVIEQKVTKTTTVETTLKDTRAPAADSGKSGNAPKAGKPRGRPRKQAASDAKGKNAPRYAKTSGGDTSRHKEPRTNYEQLYLDEQRKAQDLKAQLTSCKQKYNKLEEEGKQDRSGFMDEYHKLKQEYDTAKREATATEERTIAACMQDANGHQKGKVYEICGNVAFCDGFHEICEEDKKKRIIVGNIENESELLQALRKRGFPTDQMGLISEVVKIDKAYSSPAARVQIDLNETEDRRITVSIYKEGDGEREEYTAKEDSSPFGSGWKVSKVIK